MHHNNDLHSTYNILDIINNLEIKYMGRCLKVIWKYETIYLRDWSIHKFWYPWGMGIPSRSLQIICKD
jgi:hypothetical protein